MGRDSGKRKTLPKRQSFSRKNVYEDDQDKGQGHRVL